MTNEEIIRELEISLRLENKSETTRIRYTSIIKQAMKYFGNKKLSNVNEDELRKYAIYLQIKKGYKPSTYNNHIAAIRYVEKKVMFKKINFNKIPLQRIKTRTVVVANKEEVKKLIRRSETIEMKLILLIAVECGLRISEITRIKTSEICRKQNKLKVLGKGNKERQTILPDEVIRLMEIYYVRYRERIEGNEYLFSRRNYEGHIKADYVGRAVQRKLKEEKLEHITMHSIRHLFATEVYKKTKDIRLVKEIMGHEDIRTTLGYIHREIEVEKIKTLTLGEVRAIIGEDLCK